MDDIASRCIELIAESKGIPASSITLDSSLESLGLDSLDKINLSFSVEETFGIVIPDESLNSLRTVRDVVNGVERLSAARTPSSSAPSAASA